MTKLGKSHSYYLVKGFGNNRIHFTNTQRSDKHSKEKKIYMQQNPNIGYTVLACIRPP